MILLNYVSDAADGHYAKVGAKHGPGQSRNGGDEAPLQGGT